MRACVSVCLSKWRNLYQPLSIITPNLTSLIDTLLYIFRIYTTFPNGSLSIAPLILWIIRKQCDFKHKLLLNACFSFRMTGFPAQHCARDINANRWWNGTRWSIPILFRNFNWPIIFLSQLYLSNPFFCSQVKWSKRTIQRIGFSHSCRFIVCVEFSGSYISVHGTSIFLLLFHCLLVYLLQLWWIFQRRWSKMLACCIITRWNSHGKIDFKQNRRICIKRHLQYAYQRLN